MKTRMAIAGVVVALLIGGVIAWRVVGPPAAPVTEAALAPVADVPPDSAPAGDVPPANDTIWATNPTVKGGCGITFELWASRSDDLAWIYPPTKNGMDPPGGWRRTEAIDAEAIDAGAINPGRIASRMSTPALLNTVQNPDEWQAERQRAIEALGSRHDKRDAIVPVLTDVLLDGEPVIRMAAIEALRNLKFDDNTGSAALDRALKTEPDDVRFWFAQQVRQATSARHGVESGLLVPNLDIRIKAVELLARMGDEGKPSVPILRRLGDICDDAELRAAVGLALSQLDGNGPIPELAKALKDPDPIIRGRAALRLGRMGKAAVPALRAALKENDADVRASTLGALGRIGAEAADAVPDVKSLLKDENPLVRKLAADALRNIDH